MHFEEVQNLNVRLRETLVALAAGALVCTALMPTPAYAVTQSDIEELHQQAEEAEQQAAEAEQRAAEAGEAYEAAQSELAELQTRVEEANQTYLEAQAVVDQLNAEIAEKQANIDEIEAQLPELRERAAEAMRGMYKLQQGAPGLVSLILSSEDFNEFLTMITYIDAVQERNFTAVDELIESEKELERQKAELDVEQEAATEAAQKAQDALAEAQAARDEVQRRAEEEAARQAAEAEAAIEAARAAQAAAEEAARQQEILDEETRKREEEAAAAARVFQTGSGQNAQIEIPNSFTPSSVNWDVSRDEFIDEWGARIDVYLDGSPLAGHGRTFAEAAWDYGVDPRWSPAISCTESSKGRYCFLPNNAWGWGHVSWPDWDTAIREHVAGLSAGYGYTISVANAKKYCPPNWQFWYATTLAQMERI